MTSHFFQRKMQKKQKKRWSKRYLTEGRLHFFISLIAGCAFHGLRDMAPHGLKAQKPIAQGIALGKHVSRCTPYRGKSKPFVERLRSFVNHQIHFFRLFRC